MEATRAVALTMPIIEKAGKVTILTTGEQAEATSAAELGDYLALCGIGAEVREFARQDSIGHDLLKHGEDAEADLLIMGAYHDSFERETIFGGNTQVVVDHANMPVIFVH